MRKDSQFAKPVVILSTIAFIATILVSCNGDDDDSGPSDSGVKKSGSVGDYVSSNQGGSNAASDNNAINAAQTQTCLKTITCGSNSCSTEGLSVAIPLIGNIMCIEACCAADDKCGSSTKMPGAGALGGLFGNGAQQQTAPACIEQDQPGREDATCPKFLDNAMQRVDNAMQQGDDAGGGGNFNRGQMNGTINIQNMFGQMNYAGCCRPDGTCGYLVTASKLGCVSAEELSKSFGFGGMLGGNMQGTGGATTAPTTCTP